MVKSIQNMYNYLRYGKVVYKSKNGEVIVRKSVSYPVQMNPNLGHVNTVKTIFKDGNIERKIERNAYVNDKFYVSYVKQKNFDINTGKVIDPVPPMKEYHVSSAEKILYDHTKSGYYTVKEADGGERICEVPYPETTVIKDGVVKTTSREKVNID